MKPSLEKILREAAVCAATGYSAPHVKKLSEEDPDFPKPINLSKNGRAVGWLESEIIAYQQKRLAQREKDQGKPKQPQPSYLAAAATGRPRKTPPQPKETAPAKRVTAKGGA